MGMENKLPTKDKNIPVARMERGPSYMATITEKRSENPIYVSYVEGMESQILTYFLNVSSIDAFGRHVRGVLA